MITFESPARDAAHIGEYPRHPITALKAFRKLADDKEDTFQVFVIIRALSGRSLAQQYYRLLKDAEGGRQAYLREELAERLQDANWLAQFSDDTVGGTYRAFLKPRNLTAYGLAEESRRLDEPDIDAAHPIAWYARRQRDIHDIWHVLTGYSTDALGEACVLSFTFGQTGNLALAFLVTGALIELKRNAWRPPFGRALLEAWRHGRQAAWLPALDYVALFEMPLVEARARLRLARPVAYERVPPEARNGFRYAADAVVGGEWSRQAV
ncbi:MAG: ubiquinone biosynthesis protein [Alphaproteobacteria bacterium]|nr:ubiquinone biosynthesis protein [Alphaproteobacteria bacterium]